MNHRPVYGITKGKIIEALECLKERSEKDNPNSEKKDLTRGKTYSINCLLRTIFGNFVKRRRKNVTARNKRLSKYIDARRKP